MITELVAILAFALLFGLFAIARPDDRRETGCHGCSLRKRTPFACASCPATEEMLADADTDDRSG